MKARQVWKMGSDAISDKRENLLKGQFHEISDLFFSFSKTLDLALDPYRLAKTVSLTFS